MARFKCRSCGEEGHIDYRAGARSCPRCGSPNVQLAISAAELPDEDPIVVGIVRLIVDDDTVQ